MRTADSLSNGSLGERCSIQKMAVHYLQGSYRDVLIDGSGRARRESGWQSNRIVHTCHRLLAALMKGQSGMKGVLVWAVGSGQDDWDERAPTPRDTDARLVNETARKQLTPGQIVYLDPAGQPSASITDQLEVSIEFTAADLAPGGTPSLREFGLFGGDATAAANSGFMIDYVIHPRIDLDPAWTLKRRLQLVFGVRAAAPPEPQPSSLMPMWHIAPQPAGTGFGASLPIISLDGVGKAYAATLETNGIHVLGDLIAWDPSKPVATISRARLREFRAKAAMVTGLHLRLELFSGLAERGINRILEDTAEANAEAAGPGVTCDLAKELQEALTVLVMALDDKTLKRMTLKELFSR
jgi:hypothetical protein